MICNNHYPLVGGKIKVRKELLSKYQLQIIEDNFSLGKNRKLIPNLENKIKYKNPLSKRKRFRVAI